MGRNVARFEGLTTIAYMARLWTYQNVTLRLETERPENRGIDRRPG
jgi:hypothetical protein